MIDISTVILDAQQQILDLVYDISKKINIDVERDKQIQAGQLVSLIRVLQNTTLLLTTAEQQQITQGLISIGELVI